MQRGELLLHCESENGDRLWMADDKVLANLGSHLGKNKKKLIIPPS